MHQEIGLALVHLADRKPTWRPGLYLHDLACLDVFGRLIRVDNDLTLFVVEQVQEASGEFLLVFQHLHPLLRPVPYARRIRAHEHWRSGNDLTVLDGDIQ